MAGPVSYFHICVFLSPLMRGVLDLNKILLSSGCLVSVRGRKYEAGKVKQGILRLSQAIQVLPALMEYNCLLAFLTILVKCSVIKLFY